MSGYVPTTEQVRLDYVMAYSEKESSQILAERDFDRWLAGVEREAAEKAWWEACLRIADGENNLDIAHVYQKQNPYLEEIRNE